MLDRNKNTQSNHKWNVSGLLIGNGWIDPLRQYPAYHAFALEEDLYGGDQSKISEIEQRQKKCMDGLTNDHVDSDICENILQKILSVTTAENKCLNMYDIRLRDSYPSCGMNWPPDLTDVTPYLRRTDVTEALHINKDKRTGWTECAGAVGANFRASKSKPSIDLLPGLIEAGVPILLFSGDRDLICNHLGTEALIHEMSWSGGKGFELSPGVWAPQRQWSVNDESAGYWQEARNLTYVLFYNASHMVPFDYPRRTRDMLDRFMGVDIGSIGGRPIDSKIDGEKGLETSVGGHPNSTIAEEEQAEKLKEAEWKAYYKSGEAALVVVAIGAIIWGWWVWRERRRSRGRGGIDLGDRGLYSGIPMNGSHSNAGGLAGFRNKGRGPGDLEAGDFDEAELDDLHVESPHPDDDDGDEMDASGVKVKRYDIGSDSEDGEGQDSTTATVNTKEGGNSAPSRKTEDVL